MQDGDLSNYLKAQGSQLLPEDAIMLHCVQICLAIQYIHSKVSSIRCCWPHTLADPLAKAYRHMRTNDEDCFGHAMRPSTHVSR